MTLTIYDKQNIKDLPVIDNDDAKYAAAYLVPMIENGVERYFDNVQGEMKLLCVDGTWLLPLFLPALNYKSAYVASVYSHYISYCFDELGELKSKPLQTLSGMLLHMLGALLKAAGIDKTVYINNWLLSTNLYPDLPVEYYGPVTEFVSREYKGYAVIWNSVNERTTAEAYREMRRLGYLFLPSRSVYIVERFEGFKSKISRMLRNDTKLLEASGFHFEDSVNSDAVITLYHNLYIRKYSRYNPQFSRDFVRLTKERGLIRYIALKTDEGKPVGVYSYYVRGNIATMPIVGYDFSYEQSAGLYRQLAIKMFYDAKEQGYILHSSSGVGRFKMARGADRYWEYRVVCADNAGFFRRLAFKVLGFVISRIGVPMMDKLKL